MPCELANAVRESLWLNAIANEVRCTSRGFSVELEDLERDGALAAEVLAEIAGPAHRIQVQGMRGHPVNP